MNNIEKKLSEASWTAISRYIARVKRHDKKVSEEEFTNLLNLAFERYYERGVKSKT